MSDTIILVNEHDEKIGECEKQKAHMEGRLHRAFSIYVFNVKGEILLQKRHSGKYHSGGLWTNTCCSHPRVGETLDEAIHRRLQEEMGFDCQLEKKLEFVYKTEFDNGLTEHEYLHVYVGRYDSDPILNRDEAEDYQWISVEQVMQDIVKNPEQYTYWFRETMKRLIKTI